MNVARLTRTSSTLDHPHVGREADPLAARGSVWQRWNWLAGGLLLVAVGIAVRLYFRDIPNFSPVAAIALYAGFALRGSWRAVWIPLAVMALSDLVIGGYELTLMIVVYSMLAFPVVMGSWLRRRAERLQQNSAVSAGLVATCVGSVAFFLVTNTAVWAFANWYPSTFAGWLACLSAGLPFFRYTLCGDIAFATVLFGGHALAAAVAARIIATRVAVPNDEALSYTR